MRSDLDAIARRQRDIIRVDLSIIRGELKALLLYARKHAVDGDVKTLVHALDALDKAIRELDNPTLLHPTLF